GLDAWITSTVAQWQAPPWTQQRYRKLVQEAAGAVAVQPPHRTLPETVLASWRDAYKTPIVRPLLVQSYAPDNPPFGLDTWLSSTISQWQIAPWTQQRSAKLIQAA